MQADNELTYEEKTTQNKKKKINPVEIEGLIKKNKKLYDVSSDKALFLIIVKKFEFLFAM